MGVDPKIRGTWHIHNALEGHDDNLDFFLLTSSIAGTIGTATESNYCAANAFQDSFARWRRSKGLPAIAVGLGMISEVGYIHEHPEIEAILLRRGLHAITESELLQIIDIALTNQTVDESAYGNKHFVDGHILTGLEPQGVKRIRERGFEGIYKILEDPRTFIMARTLNPEDTELITGHRASLKDTGLPEAVLRILTESGNTNELVPALEAVIGQKIGHLLLLPVEQLSPQRPLSDFGLDSMLGAEFK